jgi:transposase InsO family protein
VAEALVNSLFCCFGVPRELHSDQGRNFESRLMQEVLLLLGLNKTLTALLHPQSGVMAESYIKTVEEHQRKIVASHQRDCDARLPIFLLAYRASTHRSTDLATDNLVFGRELCFALRLVFRTPPPPRQGWKLVTTDWPTARTAMRATIYGSIGPPPRNGSHSTFNPHGRAHTG